VGLGPTRAFVGCAAGWLTREHAGVDRGRISDGSSVPSLGRACCPHGRTAAGGRASTAPARCGAASTAASSCTPAAAPGCAAAGTARMGSRPRWSSRASGGPTSVMGSARRRTACMGTAGRRPPAASGLARSVVGRACGAGRGFSPGGLVGGAGRAASAVDRLAI
jgi:hypothetical protein